MHWPLKSKKAKRLKEAKAFSINAYLNTHSQSPYFSLGELHFSFLGIKMIPRVQYRLICLLLPILYKSAVNTIKYIRHYILFLIYCNIYLTYITTIHLGTTYPYGGCWLLLSRRGSFTICALKKNKPKLYFKLLFSLLGYDFFDQVSIFQWIL